MKRNTNEKKIEIIMKKDRKNSHNKSNNNVKIEEEDNDYTVALFTTDFSMQNLSLQLYLPIISSSKAMKIREITEQYVLRCMACLTIQPDFNRLFCNKCGVNHLSRVSASMNALGELTLHLKRTYRVEKTGMKYSLPKPGKQGRFEGELLLREDQLLSGIWKQKMVQSNREMKASFTDDKDRDSHGDNNKHEEGFASNVAFHLSKLNTINMNHANVKIGLGKKNPNAVKGRERRGKKKN